ncbi:MAG: glycosyltransferase family 39 protein, partial [Clostridia bacterium]|nr:glycosyltransferase family 39 protein [Clostridia bacterium]
MFGFSGGASYALIKFPAIVCDIITGVLIYKIAKKKFSDSVSTMLSSLYLFNPAVILNSSIWGQVDSVYTLFVLLMIYFISEKKLIYSYFVFAICIFIKPQAFIFTPVLIGGIVEQVFLDDFNQNKFWKNLGFGLCAILLMLILALPFGIGNVFEQYKATMASYPHATVNALNLWGALGMNWDSLTPAITIAGYVFIVAITVYSLYVFFKSKNEAKYYFVGAILAFFTYMLSTKMHDRYAFPAIVLMVMAFVVAPNIKNYLMYMLVSLSQFFNTAWVLFIYDQDPSKYFKSTTVTLASFINIALLIYIVYEAQKMYVADKFEVTKTTATKPKTTAKKTNKTPSQSALPKKFTLSTVFPKITRIDVIAMAVITLIYSGIALYDLGDMHAPETEYMVSDGEVTIDLGQEYTLSGYRFYLGPYHLHEGCALDITFKDASNNVRKEETLTSGSVFRWEEQPITVNARYITLDTKASELSLKEFAVLDSHGDIIQPVSASIEEGNALFDEHDEVPERQTFRNSTYFDEIYHARTGYEFVHSLNVYEWTHPPLGKVFIALGILLFG